MSERFIEQSELNFQSIWTCEEAIPKFTVKSQLSFGLKKVPDLAAIDDIEAKS